MSLANTKLWQSLLPGGVGGDTADGVFDTRQVVDDLLWSLHAASRADLTFWTEADLVQWLDEALKRLARLTGVFVGRDTTIVTTAGQATYSLPARHVSTIHVSLQTTTLRRANTVEMDALDPAYQTTPGPPGYWYEDLLGDGTIGLTPVPDTSSQAVPVVYAGYPEPLDAGLQNTFVAAPPPLKGYLAMCVLAAAYGQEGEAESPDIAAHCRERMALYETMMATYYGKGC